MLVKNRRLRRKGDGDEYFEKYTEHPEPQTARSVHPPHSPHSSGASMMDLANQAPMDAYPSRDVHYGNLQAFGTHMAQDNAPSTAYGKTASQERDYQYQYPSHAYVDNGAAGYTQLTFVQQPAAHPTTPIYTPSHPYSTPASTVGAAPPVAYREPAGRDSAYQQSIDSFYGATGGPSGQNT